MHKQRSEFIVTTHQQPAPNPQEGAQKIIEELARRMKALEEEEAKAKAQADKKS
jgi:hypothetical protein